MSGRSIGVKDVAFLAVALVATGAVAAGTSLMMRQHDPADHHSRPHAHQSGAGGFVLALGDHHLEALLEAGGRVRLFMLGDNENVLCPIPSQPLSAHVRAAGTSEYVTLTFKPEGEAGDPEGMASAFSAALPAEFQGVPIALMVTLPMGEKAYRVRGVLQPTTAEEPHAGDKHDPPMPEAQGREREREIYGQPGGGYTAADIRANGPLPPSRRFEGIPTAHDMNPNPGERICPITSTRSNPEFPWQVGGHTYEFCCPPCIGEFLQKAKEDPESILPPNEYVKKG
jgi:hypothetical protein